MINTTNQGGDQTHADAAAGSSQSQAIGPLIRLKRYRQSCDAVWITKPNSVHQLALIHAAYFETSSEKMHNSCMLWTLGSNGSAATIGLKS